MIVGLLLFKLEFMILHSRKKNSSSSWTVFIGTRVQYMGGYSVGDSFITVIRDQTAAQEAYLCALCFDSVVHADA